MIIAINKPKGPTSHDIVDAIRRKTGEKRVGHAGTLDPLASGVLVVAIGREDTKRLADIVKKEKEYIATIKLGESSTTDDAEGEKLVFNVSNIPTLVSIKEVLKNFKGHIDQVPPAYSAIKVRGLPAHRRVRKGESITLKARQVEIKNIDIEKYEWPTLELKVVTGPGVYIRSLARDIGDKLGTGAYLKDLVRTRVGEFSLETAVTVESVGKK